MPTKNGSSSEFLGRGSPPTLAMTAKVDDPAFCVAADKLKPPPNINEKILRFWRKKHKVRVEQPTGKKRLIHKRKAKIASNKLRLKGKFVTVEQAI